jgi:hypothetical protein
MSNDNASLGSPKPVFLPGFDSKERDWGKFHGGWIDVLRFARLTQAERAVFDVHVLHHNARSGESLLPEAFIAERLGVSTRTVRRANAKLRQAGLLIPAKLSEPARHRLHEPNRYRLLYAGKG